MKTVLEVLQSSEGYFAKHRIENPRLNIQHLLAHVLGKRRMDLYLEFDRVLTDAELAPVRELVRRRVQGEPLQHLLGTVDFLGRTFKTDRRALIPRPETEQLVELALPDRRNYRRILDVGTGSGIIALTLAAEIPEAQVEASDVCETALSLARENAERHGLKERVGFYRRDLLEGADGEFDLIIANLPYIDAAALQSLAPEVQHDPLIALDGGPGGLTLLSRLIADATRVLRGQLALEIGHDQAARLTAEAAEHKYRHVRIATDYQGRNRFLFAQYG